MLARNQSALCLSGGGIRSAAFALGVLQSLSARRLLTGFHYLSTVSGGGYIGGWLQRWIHECNADARKVMDRLGAGKNPPEIAALRENSNFITPRVGMGSNDTWTALAMSLRNIAINWMLFVPLMLMVVILPNLFRSGVASMAANANQYEWLLFGAAALGAVAVAFSSWFTCAGLPSYRGASPVGAGKGDGWLFWLIVFPLLIWTVCATLVLSSELIGHDAWLDDVDPDVLSRLGIDARTWLPEGALVVLMTLPPMALALTASGLARGKGYRRTFASDILPTALALLTPPVLILAGCLLFHTFAPALPGAADLTKPKAGSAAEWRAILLTVFGPLWLLGTHLALTIVFVALRRPKGKNVKPDADREWLARLSAVKAKPMLLWLIAGGSALLLNQLLDQMAASYDMSVASFLAAATGLTAVSSARSEKSGDAIGPMRDKAGKAFGFVRKLPVQMIATVAAFMFIVLLFLILARVEWTLATPIARYFEGSLEEWVDPYVVAHGILFGMLFMLTMLLSYRIEANRFSLHGLYRNRLARGFLGAARPRRDPDTFTGFDPKDNVRVHRLAPTDPDPDPQGPGTGRVLYPVINAALNVTASENLAWQERKAEPFVFTPEFSGSGMLPNEAMEEKRRIEAARRAARTDPDDPPAQPEAPVHAAAPAGPQAGETDPEPHRPHLEGAYIRSEVYGGSEPDLATGDSGVSLATAMTISGAAASPNMGYNSSPAAAFLMTLFNVRLGAWLPNPARARTLGSRIGGSSPNNSLRALLRELGGSTDDRGLDVYLSDGGHFENLAIYEMIRRRCRYILVTDAGQDAQCGFADLGNAVRKVKIDFDVDIRFGKIHIYPRDAETAHDQVAWACGTIHYPEGSGPEQTGTIVYLKPSYFGEDLPVDVVSYGRASATFPHESTGDQFFSESQFESYRRLGQFFADRLGTKPLPEGEPAKLDLPTFFRRIRKEAGL